MWKKNQDLKEWGGRISSHRELYLPLMEGVIDVKLQFPTLPGYEHHGSTSLADILVFRELGFFKQDEENNHSNNSLISIVI